MLKITKFIPLSKEEEDALSITLKESQSLLLDEDEAEFKLDETEWQKLVEGTKKYSVEDADNIRRAAGFEASNVSSDDSDSLSATLKEVLPEVFTEVVKYLAKGVKDFEFIRNTEGLSADRQYKVKEVEYHEHLHHLWKKLSFEQRRQMIPLFVRRLNDPRGEDIYYFLKALGTTDEHLVEEYYVTVLGRDHDLAPRFPLNEEELRILASFGLKPRPN